MAKYPIASLMKTGDDWYVFFGDGSKVPNSNFHTTRSQFSQNDLVGALNCVKKWLRPIRSEVVMIDSGYKHFSPIRVKLSGVALNPEKLHHTIYRVLNKWSNWYTKLEAGEVIES